MSSLTVKGGYGLFVRMIEAGNFLNHLSESAMA